MKLNINGYAQHGKDTVADLFVERHGLKKIPASFLVAEDIIAEGIIGNYHSVQECYEDRVNHRAEWYDFIREKARINPAYYVEKTLERGDMYVGHRGLFEFYETVHMFDATIWVDASGRGYPKEDRSSCELAPYVPHDFYIDNGKTIQETIEQVDMVMKLLNNKKRATYAY